MALKPNLKSQPQRVPSWQIHRANWEEFQRLCLAELLHIDFPSVEDPMELFTKTLDSIALRTIPKSSPNPTRPPKPWFDAECRLSIRARNRALNVVRRFPTPANLACLRQCQARTRRLIKQKKRQSWRQYVSGLTARTPLRQTWNMIHRIIGRPTSPQYSHLCVDGKDITEPKEITNTLGQAFSTPLLLTTVRHSSATRLLPSSGT